ncbi:D-lactaldehyde dehydrogenase [Lentinula raphanica]|uniref:D-lactaldehyde dehydrogenase n=1 Tax=Lentinula raphanica TaxID=153919 RepID=A0AA38PE85_9AGAR|nr:D-lactaldehyde dehydrogenase [Lentinula raphanica]
MPVVPTGSLVLVTGANGYIAAWIVRTLLEKGYRVRGTVRTEDKGRGLEKIFERFEQMFEFVVVPDITKVVNRVDICQYAMLIMIAHQDNAFDDAVKGVDAIAHTASPVNLNTEDPQDLIRPAVHGTESILRSALQDGSKVRRIVYTSSAAAALELGPKPRTFTEKDWNNQSVAEVERVGKDTSPINKYHASKTLAERAAWSFIENNKAVIKWDLVVLNPPLVYGPITHEVSTPSALGLTAGQFYDIVVDHSADAGGKTPEELRSTGNCWVDVRDLAEAQVLALQKHDAANERVIVSAGAFVWQEWLDVANSLAPTYLHSHGNLPKGVPITSPATEIVHQIQYDTSKADRLLGIKFRSKEDLVKDTFADYEARGW